MHPYRTHYCGALRTGQVGYRVRLSGWVHKKRDHGGVVFIDLRDHTGLCQAVCTPERPFYGLAAGLTRESVVTVTGTVVARQDQNVNPELATGQVELLIEALEVQSAAGALPFDVDGAAAVAESLRLEYRFLDLRRPAMQERLRLRAQVVSHLRQKLQGMGFCEVQTPILTASSPEGARDFLVPSRLHPGQFFALPQAPQIFKQLLMTASVDRYFQIAPCFRDEDGRAERSPGEFYQLDLEMAFVEQDEIFAALEEILVELFGRYGCMTVGAAPFVRIPYREALLRFGTDKPDLRCPLEIEDMTPFFAAAGFGLFRRIVEDGGVVRMLKVPEVGGQPRRFFDGLGAYVKEQGGGGLSYLLAGEGKVRGPLASVLGGDLEKLVQAASLRPGEALLFVAGQEAATASLAGQLRMELGRRLGRIEEGKYRFCWIVDFPMYEWDAEQRQVMFSHNPFSMPQGGLEALAEQGPLEVLAYQYDIVCNGIELSSGAIRNHLPEVMYKAFEIAGYGPAEVEARFGGLMRAFHCGAPPHGGIAPGLERMLMLLADAPNIREVTAFPLSQGGRDLMLGAPGPVEKSRLRELQLNEIKVVS